MPAPFLRIARISHVFKGQGGAAPVIYKDFALLLGLDRAPRYDPWQINFRYILETSLARLLLTCLSFVHFLDWAFVRGVGRRHLHPWCSITTVLTMVSGARKGAISGLAIADPPCVCERAQARSFEKTKGRVRRRNFRLSRRAKRGPSSGSLCPATLLFLVLELGSQIWSLQCLPQRARSCFCDQYWSHFWGPKACLRE